MSQWETDMLEAAQLSAYFLGGIADIAIMLCFLTVFAMGYIAMRDLFAGIGLFPADRDSIGSDKV